MVVRFALWSVALAGCVHAQAAPTVVVTGASAPVLPPLGAMEPLEQSQAEGPVTKLEFEVGQVWSGHYVCRQGETDLVLRVLDVRDRVMEARFEFSHEPSGTEGSFVVSGAVASGKIVLSPLRWEDQPPGYVMVGLTGTVQDRRFTGRVDGPGCAEFQLTLNEYVDDWDDD